MPFSQEHIQHGLHCRVGEIFAKPLLHRLNIRRAASPQDLHDPKLQRSELALQFGFFRHGIS
jgi:hypothetical protein